MNLTSPLDLDVDRCWALKDRKVTLCEARGGIFYLLLKGRSKWQAEEEREGRSKKERASEMECGLDG